MRWRKLLPSFKGKGGLLGWKQEEQPASSGGEAHRRHRGTAALNHSLGSPGGDLPPRAPNPGWDQQALGPEPHLPDGARLEQLPRLRTQESFTALHQHLAPAKGLAWRSTEARDRGRDVRAQPTARRHVLTSWSPRPAGRWARPASWRSCAVSETSPGPGLLWRRNRLWSVSQRPDLKTRKTRCSLHHSN